MEYRINLHEIAEKLDFNLEDVETVVEAFLGGAKTSLKEMKSALNTHDYTLLSRAAHTIKGSAANIFLEEIVSLSKEIEKAAKEENETTLTQKIEILESLIQSITF